MRPVRRRRVGWWRAVWRRSALNAEMEAEFRSHIELRAEDLMRSGVAPAEAVRRARLEFGGTARYVEEGREARGLGPLDALRGDLRYALRALRRNPGFAAVALLTVGLGIGANTAVFSIVNGVLLRPLPYPDPASLVLLHQSNPRSGELLGRVSHQDLEDWEQRARSLDAVAGHAPVPTILTGRGEPVELELTYVTEGFFELLGAPMVLGRPLVEGDHRQRQRSAVIAEGLWRTTLGADPGVIGGTILLRGEPFTVVGVAPARMRHPTPETSVWVPHTLIEPNMFANGMPARGDRYLNVVARLAAGADAEAAQAELTRVSAELAATHPESNQDWTAAAVVPLHASITGDVDQALLIVLGAVGFILLIVCANLANLLLARGSARTREVAVRAAIGASRGRIVKQLLTESVVLGVLGGVLGVVLAYWGVQILLGLSADTLPRVEDVRLDGRVIAFAFVLAAATGLVFGLAPALRMAGTDPQHDLRGGRGTVGSAGGRLRSLLVVAEVALAVLLVIGAGLMARSFLALRNVDPGFDPDRVLTVSMQINYAGIPEAGIGRFLVQRREEILQRVRELPAVEEAGMINVFPLSREDALIIEYRPSDGAADGAGVHADTRYIDPGYLPTMGIPLLAGEWLPDQLAQGAPVPVVLSESAARRLWPEQDPIGRRIAVPWGESVVAGVVGDVRQAGLDAAPQPAVYFPQLIAPRLLATLVVRTAGDPMALAAPVRGIIRDIDPDQPIRRIMPLTGVMSESIAQDRFFTLLFAAFGGLALVLAAVGIYGVLAYSVRQRTQEIGVRMALGAGAYEVVRMVSGAGMRLVAIGSVIGALGALALGRVLASQLYGIAPDDPLTFVLALAFLGTVALLATCLPALRATRVPPMTALRPD